jgi:L-asparagine transporter-like permease
MSQIMGKVVEIIVLIVGALIIFGGEGDSLYATFLNATESIGGSLGDTMSMLMSIIIPLIFLFVGLEVCFPGVITRYVK